MLSLKRDRLRKHDYEVLGEYADSSNGLTLLADSGRMQSCYHLGKSKSSKSVSAVFLDKVKSLTSHHSHS